MAGKGPSLGIGLALAAALGLGPLSCSGSSAGYAYPPYFTESVALADFNGDSKLDMVTSNAPTWSGNGFITVRLQDSTQPGGFQAPVRTATAGPTPGNLAAGSLGNGASPGVAVVNFQPGPMANPANSVSVFLPSGAQPGTFLAPATLAVGTRNPQDVALGDLANSGLAAVAVAADGGNDLLVFFQTSAGVFNPTPTSVPVGGVPSAVAIADLRGIGVKDLIVATTGNTVAVALNDPSSPGTFSAGATSSYTVGSNPVSVRAASLTGSAQLDIVTANAGTGLAYTTQGLTVLLHAAPGSFQPAQNYDCGDYISDCVAVGAIPGGIPSIAVANAGLPGSPGSVSVFLGNGDGTFQPAALYPGIYGPMSVAIGDLDGDGLADLAIADGGGVVVRYQQSGEPGTFGPGVGYLQ